MGAYLDFKEISKVPFRKILDHLGLPYSETQSGEFKGERFIVSQDKNLFLNPLGPEKGSIINFWSMYHKVDLRTAALEIKNLFIDPPAPKTPTLPNYPFIYHDYLKGMEIPEETAQEYGFTYVKKGILAGKIAVQIKDPGGITVGYVGKNLNNDGWFYPKQFKAGKYLFNLHRVQGDQVILTSNPFKVAKFSAVPAVSLLGLSMTEDQESLLKGFSQIAVDHPRPDNIILRLSRFAWTQII
jgi:hypothetical protein